MPANRIVFHDDWHDALVQQGNTSDRTGVWTGAISASVLLHAAIFGLLITLTLPSGNHVTAPDEVRDGIIITLVRKPAVPEEIQAGAKITGESTSMDVSLPEPETAGNDVGPESVITPDIPKEAPQQPQADRAVETGSGDDSRETVRDIATPSDIRRAINSYVESQDGELHRAYVESCIRYRNRHGMTSDCPEDELFKINSYDEEKKIADELFANVTRKTDDARVRARLQRENELLYAMMNERDNPASEQSAVRFRLNEQYRRYLNGNRSEGLYNVDMMTMALGNDYGRTTFAVPYQFRCKLLRPCIYKYTGFSVERPEYMAEEIEKLERQTPLFMPASD